MESDEQRQLLISYFLKLNPAVQEVKIAVNFLKETNWKLEDAINLYESYMYQIPIWDPITQSSSPNLFFNGSFEDAEATASKKDKWLLVNFQSTSHALNRGLWLNDAVSRAIKSSFILCQVYDHTSDGKRISTFYKIESSPPTVVLVDPITGLMVRMWSGVIEPQRFLKDLMNYMNDGPQKQIPFDLLFKHSPHYQDMATF